MSRPPEIALFERLDLTPGVAREGPAGARVAGFDVSRIPASPGCYLMRDDKDRVIYVGKAVNLRARLRSYFNETDSRYTVKFLMRKVARIDFFVTINEKEALLLENSLIKEHKPRYNIQLRDDKTYVSLRVNVQHQFPRVTVTRQIRKDGSRYFGPYASALSVRETVKQMQRIIPLRLCSDSVLANRGRPCLYHQMRLCSAPCVGLIDEAGYRDLVNDALLMLEGRNAELEKQFLDRIRAHSEKLEFEKAAVLRDRLYALRRTLEGQQAVQIEERTDRDAIGIHAEGRYSEIQVLVYRGGKLTGGRSFSFNHRETPLTEVLSSFLMQYYTEAPSLPAEILLPLEIEGADTLAEVLSEARGGSVRIHHPRRGDKRRLVELADRNARRAFEEKRLAERANRDLIAQLKEALHLRRDPQRIECFDISTIQGRAPVGSMVTFQGGQPDKSRYRRYAIKVVEGQDDFGMMREMLLRRFKRAVEEQDLPDLVVVDGGKGQLNVATTVFKDLGIEDLEVVSLAKSRALEGGGRSPERFFVPGRKDPIVLPQRSPVVLFVARVRDEAHRFAITYHRKRRHKATLTNPLMLVPGVGPKRARALLNALGSLAKVREATVETIAAVPGFSLELARAVKAGLAVGGPIAREGE